MLTRKASVGYALVHLAMHLCSQLVGFFPPNTKGSFFLPGATEPNWPDILPHFADLKSAIRACCQLSSVNPLFCFQLSLWILRICQLSLPYCTLWCCQLSLNSFLLSVVTTVFSFDVDSCLNESFDVVSCHWIHSCCQLSLPYAPFDVVSCPYESFDVISCHWIHYCYQLSLNSSRLKDGQ
jgi:hypothetical protein